MLFFRRGAGVCCDSQRPENQLYHASDFLSSVFLCTICTKFNLKRDQKFFIFVQNYLLTTAAGCGILYLQKGKERYKDMTTKRFYIHINDMGVIDKIEMEFPCFIITEPVEMDFQMVTIQARNEDIEIIEKRIKKVVDKY